MSTPNRTRRRRVLGSLTATGIGAILATTTAGGAAHAAEQPTASVEPANVSVNETLVPGSIVDTGNQLTSVLDEPDVIIDLDRDGDGQVDLWGLDLDGDGWIDVFVMDNDGDGWVDEWVFPTVGPPIVSVDPGPAVRPINPPPPIVPRTQSLS